MSVDLLKRIEAFLNSGGLSKLLAALTALWTVFNGTATANLVNAPVFGEVPGLVGAGGAISIAYFLPKLLALAPKLLAWYKAANSDGKVNISEYFDLGRILITDLGNLKPDQVKAVEASVGSVEIARRIQLEKAWDLIRGRAKELGDCEAYKSLTELAETFTRLSYEKDGVNAGPA